MDDNSTGKMNDLDLLMFGSSVMMSTSYFHWLQAYIHSRMRAKTTDFLKVLNRARPEPKTAEKKTIT